MKIKLCVSVFPAFLISWLLVAAAATPALAGEWKYDNGGPYGYFLTEAPLNDYYHYYVVSDTFRVEGTDPIQMFAFGAWVPSGRMLTSVDWAITAYDTYYGGKLLAHGTANGTNLTSQLLYTDQGYDLYGIEVAGKATGLPVYGLQEGQTFYFSLYNAVVNNDKYFGGAAYWDVNFGFGCGSLGCPSDAYLGDPNGGDSKIHSEYFKIQAYIPEPGSMLLFGSGVLGLAGLLRRKLSF